MSELQLTVTLPWPVVQLTGKSLTNLRVGDRVLLKHVVHREWMIGAKVTRVQGVAFGPGKSVEVLPDEPITSPANWEVI